MSKISIEYLRSIVFKIADVNDILLQNTNLRRLIKIFFYINKSSGKIIR